LHIQAWFWPPHWDEGRHETLPAFATPLCSVTQQTVSAVFPAAMQSALLAQVTESPFWLSQSFSDVHWKFGGPPPPPGVTQQTLEPGAQGLPVPHGMPTGDGAAESSPPVPGPASSPPLLELEPPESVLGEASAPPPELPPPPGLPLPDPGPLEPGWPPDEASPPEPLPVTEASDPPLLEKPVGASSSGDTAAPPHAAKSHAPPAIAAEAGKASEARPARRPAKKKRKDAMRRAMM
jgi:hypothetical protein